LAFPALLDTCVLYPQYLCDTLLTQAQAETFRPLWSSGILAELGRNLAGKAQLSAEQVNHRLGRMRRSFPDAEITGYEALVAGTTTDEKDRHVLAAAVRGNAEVLVTFNLRHFPETALAPFDITAVHPDEFLLDQLDLYPGLVLGCLEQQVRRYTHPDGPVTVDELMGSLEHAGVARFAAAVRRNLER
jgi:predicted nucleic acid-binding protein